MLDRLRQNVAVKELLQSAGRPLMRKTASVPNFSHVSTVHPLAVVISAVLCRVSSAIIGRLVTALIMTELKADVVPQLRDKTTYTLTL